ncbi:uncharacterized protein SCHCODRAFT_02559883 [Schizophyllum commune H4-8]|nr:uncharacterized protein SCHCODRAFT_02559883 [Schizophyllum commune H4-8]KAI5900852.1 hypothetical protein SCHCODRAFT_02559883 [Schizophyllum commune H4-8]
MARTTRGSASSKRPQSARRENTRDERPGFTTASDSRPRKRVKKEAASDEAEVDTEVKQDDAALSSRFTDLPLELVLEVLSHLDARSLLQLARTTKLLRSLLLSRSSIKIWKRGYNYTKPAMPPPPSDMSIPRLLAFLEDEICDFCDESPDDGVLTVWSSWQRFCEGCADSIFCLIPDEYIRDFHVVKKIIRLCGHSYQPVDLLPSVVLQVYHGFYGREVVRYSRAAYDKLAKQFEHATAGKPKEYKKEWVAGWVENLRKSLRHVEAWESWDYEREERKEAERRITHRQRIDEILQRLGELGWADEIQKPAVSSQLRSHELVDKTKRLTDEEWASIRGPLLKLLQELRDKRLEQERQVLLRERYRTLKEVHKDRIHNKTQQERCFMPGAGELAGLKEVTDAIERTPVDRTLTKDDLQSIIDAIPQARWDEWNAARAAALVNMLNRADAPPRHGQPATTEDLQLATTVFTYSYETHLTYPEVLGHRDGRCSTAGTPKSSIKKKWSVKDYKIQLSRQRIAARVVRLAGLDPKTATAAEMDARNVWFATTGNVRASNHDLCAMTWRGAIMECYPEDQIVTLPAKRVAQAQELLAQKKCGDGDPALYVDIPRGRKTSKK